MRWWDDSWHRFGWPRPLEASLWLALMVGVIGWSLPPSCGVRGGASGESNESSVIGSELAWTSPGDADRLNLVEAEAPRFSVVGPRMALGLGSERALRPPLLDPVPPQDFIAAAAEQLFYGSPTRSEFSVMVDLAVTLNRPKYLRGMAARIPLQGQYHNLGQGTGRSRMTFSGLADTAVEMQVFSQQTTAIVWSTTPAGLGLARADRLDVTPQVSVQPAWMIQGGASGVGTVAAYGSPVALLQWLPHHFELEWRYRDEERVHLGLLGQWLRDHADWGDGLESIPSGGGPPIWDVVGVARGGLVADGGRVVGASNELSGPGSVQSTNSSAGNDPRWSIPSMRGVAGPVPHWVVLRLAALPDGQVRPTHARFFRLHPFQERAERMVEIEWVRWEAAPQLRLEDVQRVDGP